jgi:hypothetical protein
LELEFHGKTLKGGFFDTNKAQKDSFIISKNPSTATGGDGGGGGVDPNPAVKDKHGVRKIYATKAGSKAKDAYMMTIQEILAGGSNLRSIGLQGTTSTTTAGL